MNGILAVTRDNKSFDQHQYTIETFGNRVQVYPCQGSNPSFSVARKAQERFVYRLFYRKLFVFTSYRKLSNRFFWDNHFNTIQVIPCPSKICVLI